MWWSAAMLAKIGGGELTPVTALGRMIAAITVMLGIFCFALPVAIAPSVGAWLRAQQLRARASGQAAAHRVEDGRPTQ